MKINKKLLVLAAAGVFIAFSADYSIAQTAEVSAEKSNDIKIETQKIPEIKVGTVVSDFSRVSEETTKKILKKSFNCDAEKVVYVDSINGCLTILKSGKADSVLATDISADYIIKRNQDIKSIVLDKKLAIVMVLRKSDDKLRDSLDSAIDKIKKSGKYDELYKNHITDLPVGQEPSVTKVEKIPDAETIYIGINGNLPPLDYIAADGKPAGFNVAFISEISKLIGKNIEIISLDSSARLTALEAKKIDIFFWTFMPENKAGREKFRAENPEEEAFNKKFITSGPYCFFKPAFLLKK